MAIAWSCRDSERAVLDGSPPDSSDRLLVRGTGVARFSGSSRPFLRSWDCPSADGSASFCPKRPLVVALSSAMSAFRNSSSAEIVSEPSPETPVKAHVHHRKLDIRRNTPMRGFRPPFFFKRTPEDVLGFGLRAAGNASASSPAGSLAPSPLGLLCSDVV